MAPDGARPGQDTADNATRHLIERVRLLYGQAIAGVVGSMLCAVLIAGALLPAGDADTLAVWLSVMTAIGLARIWLIVRFRRSPRQAEAVHAWLHAYLALTLLSGLGYGYATVALVSDQTGTSWLFLLIAVTCVTSGSVATYSAVQRVVLAFCLPALLPLTFYLVFVETDPLHLIYAAGVALYAAVLMVNGLQQSRTIEQTLRIRFDNLDLIATLEAAKGKAEALNDSLKAEIAERGRAETNLARTIALYQATMDAVDDGILAVDHLGRVVAVNRRFKQAWSLSDEDIAIGAAPDRIMSKVLRQMADTEAFLSESAAEAPGSTEPHRGLIELRDGRVFERYSVPYRLNGDVIGRVRTVRDVTARIGVERAMRRAKEAAEAANRAKSDFLAHISHELRTPLNAIIGFSDILRREMFGALPNDRYRDYAADIHDSATLLLSLINDVLDLSKIEAGRIELVEEKVAIAPLVANTVRLVRDRAHAAGVALDDETPADLPVLYGDARACKQMLANLLTNAVKFTEAGGRITVTAAIQDNGELVLAVTDTGIGMAPEDIPRALEPFSQIGSPMTRQHQGTGLGLPLVKALVEAHGGRLELDSAPGRGTSARLVFPPSRLIAPPSMPPLAVS